MRVKKLTGSYRQVCELLAYAGAKHFENLIVPEDITTVRVSVLKDIYRIPLIGSWDQKAKICDSWSTTTAYSQGDESGLKLLNGLSLCDVSLFEPYIIEDSTGTTRHLSSHLIRAGYWTDSDTVGGMSLFCRQDKLSEWMFCTVTNASASLNERIVTIYFSEILAARFELLKNIRLEDVDFCKDLKVSLQANEIFQLVNNVILNNGSVDLAKAKSVDEISVCFGCCDKEQEYIELFNKTQALLKIKDSISLKKARVYTHVINLIDKSHSLKSYGSDQSSKIVFELSKSLYEKCNAYFSLHSTEFTHADWSALQSECQKIIEDAKPQLKDFELPNDFFKLDLLYIELYCKRSNLLCQNKMLSFRKAQVYDQLMSMIDSVQDLQEKWHYEDACRLLALISDLKVRFERLLLLPEDQISAADWLRFQQESNILIQEAKKNIANYKLPEKWCSLELTYLELEAHQKQSRRSNNMQSRKKATVYTHLLELLDKADSMKRSEYREDAPSAIELALRLTETCKPYLTSSSPKINWKKLKKECKLIVSEAEYKLAYYGFLQLILTNLLLAVTGLCLLKAAFTGSFFIHNSSEECAQEIQETASLVRTFGSAAG